MPDTSSAKVQSVVDQQQRGSMDFTALCSVVAVMRILPNKSQFFLYDSVTLICVDNNYSSDWTVKRITTNNKSTECSLNWGKRKGSHCLIDTVYQFDSGQYWCESRTGACSEFINVTVTDGPVILESPVLPVAEGETVILRCIHNKHCSNFTQFYKDGLLIGNSSTGNITIREFSKSDQGLYKCNIIGNGESPESWLLLRGSKHDPFHFHPPYVLLPVFSCLLLACVMLLYLRRNCKDKEDNDDVSYTDVTFSRKGPPKTHAEITSEPTLYSTIRPEGC